MLQLGQIEDLTGILCLPHCGKFDIRVCQIPTIAPYNPEGGVVGEYIDRCIRPPLKPAAMPRASQVWSGPGALSTIFIKSIYGECTKLAALSGHVLSKTN